MRRHPLASGLAFALAPALAGSVPAQCACGAPEQHHPMREQEPCGRWSAARSGGADRADADLRVTSLMTLAILGDGHTLRSGRHRDVLRRAIRWLCAQQDERGRLGLRGDPAWILDHAIAAYALAEAMRVSAARHLVPHVARAADAMRDHVATARPAPGVEARLWCELVERSLRASAALAFVPTEGDTGFAPELGADGLAKALAALPPAAASTPREEAAQRLRDALAGRSDAGSDLLAAWPDATMHDPLAAFYVAATAFRRGGAVWQGASARLRDECVGRQTRSGEHYGTWNPLGCFGEEHGRAGATAAAYLLMQVYYRFSKLDVCGGQCAPAVTSRRRAAAPSAPSGT